MVHTKTSSFGVSGRYNHDSTDFYDSKLYKGMNIPKKVKYLHEYIPQESINKIFCKSSETMNEIPTIVLI